MNDTETLQQSPRRAELDVLRPQDRELCVRFVEHLRKKGRSNRLLQKRAWELRKISELLPKPFQEMQKTDFEDLMDNIRHANTKRGTPISKAYQFDLVICTRAFYKWFLGAKKNEEPELLRDFEMSEPRPEKILPSKVITPDEVLALTKSTTDKMEKALVAFAYASGARIGEVTNMRVRDVFYEGNDIQVRLDGKTGERILPLGWPPAIRLLTEYLEESRRPGDAPLWVSKRGKPVSYSMAYAIFDRVNQLSGVFKQCNPHWFRHSRATELGKSLTDQQLKYYFGWTADSAMTGRYIHADRTMVADKFREIYPQKTEAGLDEELATVLHVFAKHFSNPDNRTRLKATLKAVGEKEKFQKALSSLLDPEYAIPYKFQLSLSPAGQI